MRAFGRLVAAILALIALAGAGLFAARYAIAERIIIGALKARGATDPSLRVTRLDLGLDRGGVKVADLSIGPASAPELSVSSLEVEIDWGALRRTGEVERIAVGPAFAHIRMSETAMSIGGMTPPSAAPVSPGASALAIGTLIVDGVDILLTADGGEARGRLEGAYTAENGAAFDLTARTDAFALSAFGFGAAELQTADVAAGVRFLGDGSIRIKADATGALMTPFGRIDGVDVSAAGEGGSWKAAQGSGIDAVTAAARVEIRSSRFSPAEGSSLARLAALATPPDSGDGPGGGDDDDPTGGALGALALAGLVDVTLSDGVLRVAAAGDPALAFRADRGDALAIYPLPGEALLSIGDREGALGLRAVLTGAVASGNAVISARRRAADAWTFDIASEVGALQWSDIAVNRAAVAARGDLTGGTLGADVDLDLDLKAARLGRLDVTGAPVEGSVRLQRAGPDAPFVVFPSPAGPTPGCIAFRALRARIPSEGLDAALKGATLCTVSGEPLAVFGGADRADATVIGRLEAEGLSARFGETQVSGRPPWAEVRATYSPAAHQTRAEGRFGGGAIVVNSALAAGRFAGRFGLGLDAAELTAEATIEEAMIAQATTPAAVSPVAANADIRLADDIVAFDYRVSTPAGAPLGEGEGRHALLTGAGLATFRSDRLQFSAGGLQPASLAPVLRGVVSDARGASSVDASATWGKAPGSLSARATIDLEDLSFRGPGVAVSETLGLDGTLSFASLAPLRSDGVQSLSIGRIDLDALILEGGEATFELPGDETLRVLKAEFPWFGGTLGAYDTTLALTGARAETALRAANVNLGELLEYVKVDALSGEGVVEGVLPIVVENSRARIEDGRLNAIGPGVLRYNAPVVDAAGGDRPETKMAFDLLRNLRFEKLGAVVNGPLDGDLVFNVVFEGTNEVTLDHYRLADPVVSPVVYRINLQAPLLALIENARRSVDYNILLEDVRRGAIEVDEDKPVSEPEPR